MVIDWAVSNPGFIISTGGGLIGWLIAFRYRRNMKSLQNRQTLAQEHIADKVTANLAREDIKDILYNYLVPANKKLSNRDMFNNVWGINNSFYEPGPSTQGVYTEIPPLDTGLKNSLIDCQDVIKNLYLNYDIPNEYFIPSHVDEFIEGYESYIDAREKSVSDISDFIRDSKSKILEIYATSSSTSHGSVEPLLTDPESTADKVLQHRSASEYISGNRYNELRRIVEENGFRYNFKNLEDLMEQTQSNYHNLTGRSIYVPTTPEAKKNFRDTGSLSWMESVLRSKYEIYD